MHILPVSYRSYPQALEKKKPHVSSVSNPQGFSHENKPAQPAFEGGGVLKGICTALAALGVTIGAHAQSGVPKVANKVTPAVADTIASIEAAAIQSKIVTVTADITSATAKKEAAQEIQAVAQQKIVASQQKIAQAEAAVQTAATKEAAGATKEAAGAAEKQAGAAEKQAAKKELEALLDDI